jgi:hypothetical protein
MKPLDRNRLQFFCAAEASGPFSYIHARTHNKVTIISWQFIDGDFVMRDEFAEDYIKRTDLNMARVAFQADLNLILKAIPLLSLKDINQLKPTLRELIWNLNVLDSNARNNFKGYDTDKTNEYKQNQNNRSETNG